MPDATIGKLLIRAPNWIGDAVMSEPALAAARHFAPRAEITLLAKPSVGELLKGHPSLDRLCLYEAPGRHEGLAGKWRLGRELRRERFDMAILLQNAFEAALLARLAGVPRRYGYATDGRGWLLSEPVPLPDGAPRMHQTAYYRRLVQPLAGDLPARAPRLYLTEEDETSVAACLRREGAGEGDVLIGVNPGSTYGRAKRWLPERFAAAADAVAAQLGAGESRPVRVVLVGARGEEEVAAAIAAAMTTRPISLVGKTSVRQLMAAVRRCRVFLTNDTGPMHIAAAFGVPVVAVFGPTDPRTTAPIGDRTALVRHQVDCAPCLLRECPIDHRCMTGVGVDEVVEAAVRLTRADARTPPLAGVAVFLDRDGTLNRDTGYLRKPEELELLPEAGTSIARLNQAGARVVVVTNQSGVGRGYISPDDLTRIHDRLRDLLAEAGARLDGIYACPHHPDDGCACRKPGTALAERAVADLGLDLSRAYVIGDQERDMALAHRIGAKGVLVTNGVEEGGRPRPVAADCVARDLARAVDWIMEDVKKVRGEG